MKISISFPPINSKKGVPLLSQNRQFQWFNKPTYIYPMVPASLATLMKDKGHEVIWDDAIGREMNYEKWLLDINSRKPDVVFIEAKTPIITTYWKVIDTLKSRLPKTKFVLYGDHVTFFPEESLRKSSVDFVMIGGDYDFIAEGLIDYLVEGGDVPKGVAKIDNDKFVTGGFFDSEVNLDDLPIIDRELTNWQLYAFKNGNFKYYPGTYTMFGRDCWWRKDGGCTFCSWTNTYRKFRRVSVEKALKEVELLHSLGVKEVFDDTGSFPTGDFLKKFCEGIIKRGLHKKMSFGCNMRPDALSLEEYSLMKKTNFRLVLFGLESANQTTLDRINKGTTVDKIVDGLKRAKKAGLEVHITTMIGYPWETLKDARKTIELAKKLFNEGHISTLQATVVIPYPGTRLYNECIKNNWLRVTDYDRYDQREQVMKSELKTEDVLNLTQGLYKSFLTPRFIFRKVLEIRSFRDVKYYFMAALRVLGHLKDFSK